ncbi:MAG: energy-coupling factor transporter transmembrane protein EcfT [Oscillospiraceae bacterium]|nr:energy-coupling factor transporter transmembrane protein EcfT [Oscillospiraceae bacterium]
MELFDVHFQKRGLIFDPRTKLFTMLTIVIFVVGGYGTVPDMLVFFLEILPILLLLTVGKFKKAFLYSIIYGTAQASMLWGIAFLPETVRYIVTLFAVFIIRISPGMIMGAYIFSSTTVSEFMAAMQKMHVPNQISIPLSVMFRFFPTVMEEFESINHAMAMRDIRFGGKNAMKIIEYKLVPLMICSVKIGNELSAAALTRGLNANAKRTNICEIGFHVQDIFLFLIMLVPYAAVIFTKLGVLS